MRFETTNVATDRSTQWGTCTVTLPALLAGASAVNRRSIFVEPGKRSHPRPTATYHTPEEANAQAVQQLDYYRRISDEREDIEIVSDAAALDRVLENWATDDPRLGVFIVMEGAEPILDPRDLGWWVERGLRGIGFSWSAGTRYAGGNASPGPITDDGHALLHAMADYNLLLDICHLWEEAAHTVLERYPGPIVATHANPRAFVDSPRMLSDEPHPPRGRARGRDRCRRLQPQCLSPDGNVGQTLFR